MRGAVKIIMGVVCEVMLACECMVAYELMRKKKKALRQNGGIL